jgi:hypothetical protein
MLAYYLQWHLTERLAPLLDGQRDDLKAGSMEPKERCWTLDNILQILSAQRRVTVSFSGTTFLHITEPNADQTRLLQLSPPPRRPPKTRQDLECSRRN